MRRIALALIIAGFAGAAAAQGVSPDGVIYGKNWALPQNFTKPDPVAPSSGIAAERAARAARQASYNQNFPGTPIRPASARR